MKNYILIFGASGDLAKLKIYPALDELYRFSHLDDYKVIGYARSNINNSDFETLVCNSIQKNYPSKAAVLESKIVQNIEYFSGQYNLDDISKMFEKIKTESGDDLEIICYFSVPPKIFGSLLEVLAHFKQTFRLKIVIEKPFGVDLATAKELYFTISDNFEEDQIYLLDHYLGKTGVREILYLKQNNAILSSLIKGQNIRSIQISALETIGVEDRLGYFNEVGSLRDMTQSHLMQILALICMDLPIDEKSVPREKGHILASIDFSGDESDAVFGQYKSYKKHSPEVSSSSTDTWSAVKLHLDLQEWTQVPVYLRTGKKLAAKQSTIVIEFQNLFTQKADAVTNKLQIDFSSEAGLSLSLNTSQGTSDLMGTFPDLNQNLSDYATLLRDVVENRKLHFVTFTQILECWRVIDKIRAVQEKSLLHIYSDNQNLGFEDDILSGDQWFDV
jgi:glucose-6-phosphate 1-dehydrogenase